MKKLLSICLIAILLCSVAVVPASANNGEKTMHTLEQAMAYGEEELGYEIPTRTLYFYFRDDWKYESNDYYDASVGLDSCLPAVYWYGDVSCEPDKYPIYEGNGWPGYILTDEVAPNVYKAEIPKDVHTVVLNNGIDSGHDQTQSIYLEGRQTPDVPAQGYDGADSYGFYPEGIPEQNFDNMILVVDPDNDIGKNSFLTFPLYYSGWFYYYGDGEYGTAPAKEEAGKMIYRDGEFPSSTLDAKPDSVEIGVGGEVTIQTNKTDVSAVSDNNEIVTVTPKNEEKDEFILTGVSLGETKVTFSYYNEGRDRTETDTVIVTVTVAEPKLIIENKKLSAGESATLTIENKGSAKVNYSSSNPNVAKVNKNGKVTALSKGKTTITATVGDTELTCKIKVKNNPKLVNSKGKNAKAVTVRKGKKITLTLKGKAKGIKNIYGNSKKAKIVSKSNAKKIKIKGIKKGTSKVTVKVNNVKKFTVKVKVI